MIVKSHTCQIQGFREALGHGLQSFFKCFESAWSLSCWCRGCLKTEERMRTAPALAAKNFLARRFQMESCSHANYLERYETRPEVPLLLLSFDAEFAAVVLT